MQLATDEQVKEVLQGPLKGEPKTGVLRGVRVVKFKADDRQYLLAYTFRARVNTIEVLDIGVHENKSLQDYLAGHPMIWRLTRNVVPLEAQKRV